MCVCVSVRWGGGGGGSKIDVAHNGLKHILVFEFLKSDEIFEIGSGSDHKQASNRTNAEIP